MQAAFTLPHPMLPGTVPVCGESVEPAECSTVGMQSASASPCAVAPGAEGPPNLAPCMGQHVAGLCNQAKANQAARELGQCALSLPFHRACVQYRCVECSRSVSSALSTPRELGGENGASTTRGKGSAAVPGATTGIPRATSQTKQNKTIGFGCRRWVHLPFWHLIPSLNRQPWLCAPVKAASRIPNAMSGFAEAIAAWLSPGAFQSCRG